MMKNRLTHFAIHIDEIIEKVKSKGGQVIMLKTVIP